MVGPNFRLMTGQEKKICHPAPSQNAFVPCTGVLADQPSAPMIEMVRLKSAMKRLRVASQITLRAPRIPHRDGDQLGIRPLFQRQVFVAQCRHRGAKFARS